MSRVKGTGFAAAAAAALLWSSAAFAQLPPCPSPNPNLQGPPHFQDGCPLPAAGLNKAAPIDSPAFTGNVTINGVPAGSGTLLGDVTGPATANLVTGLQGRPLSATPPLSGQTITWNGTAWMAQTPASTGTAANPAAPIGSLQYNLNGTSFGGYNIGGAFTTAGGTFNVGTGLILPAMLAPNAACFNLGPWSGDLTGAACAAPSLASGAASRNVGNLGGGLTGTLPNPGLNTAAIISAVGSLAGDVTGTLSTTRVTALQGFPLSATPPTPSQLLTWNGSTWMAQTPPLAGINQLSGDVTTPVGVGLQPATIAAGVVTNAKLAAMQPLSVKANSQSSIATPQDVLVSSGLGFVNGNLAITPSGVVAQSITVCQDATCTANVSCWTLDGTGRVTNIAAGQTCTVATGVFLTADDGTTQLTADDGTTLLTASAGSGGGTTPCTNLQADLSLATGCNTVAIPVVIGL